jgi:hypothetical protein
MILYCYYSLTPKPDTSTPSDESIERCIGDHFLEPFNHLKEEEQVTMDVVANMKFGTLDILITNYIPKRQKLEQYTNMFNVDNGK